MQQATFLRTTFAHVVTHKCFPDPDPDYRPPQAMTLVNPEASPAPPFSAQRAPKQQVTHPYFDLDVEPSPQP